MIEFRNINFRYAGGTDAGGLVNINLSIGVQGVQTRLKRNVRFESK